MLTLMCVSECNEGNFAWAIKFVFYAMGNYAIFYYIKKLDNT